MNPGFIHDLRGEMVVHGQRRDFLAAPFHRLQRLNGDLVRVHG
jgi:hypothetical protein